MHTRQAIHDYMTATMLTTVTLFMVLAFCCAGCASQPHVWRVAAVSRPGGSGNLPVRVSESRQDRRSRIQGHWKVAVQLHRTEAGGLKLISEETRSRWIATGLLPGSNVVRIVRWADQPGVARVLPKRREERFVVSPRHPTLANLVMRQSHGQTSWLRNVFMNSLVMSAISAQRRANQMMWDLQAAELGGR